MNFLFIMLLLFCVRLFSCVSNSLDDLLLTSTLSGCLFLFVCEELSLRKKIVFVFEIIVGVVSLVVMLVLDNGINFRSFSLVLFTGFNELSFDFD